MSLYLDSTSYKNIFNFSGKGYEKEFKLVLYYYINYMINK